MRENSGEERRGEESPSGLRVRSGCCMAWRDDDDMRDADDGRQLCPPFVLLPKSVSAPSRDR